jgi:hypothetical protein
MPATPFFLMVRNGGKRRLRFSLHTLELVRVRPTRVHPDCLSLPRDRCLLRIRKESSVSESPVCLQTLRTLSQ